MRRCPTDQVKRPRAGETVARRGVASRILPPSFHCVSESGRARVSTPAGGRSHRRGVEGAPARGRESIARWGGTNGRMDCPSGGWTRARERTRRPRRRRASVAFFARRSSRARGRSRATRLVTTGAPASHESTSPSSISASASEEMSDRPSQTSSSWGDSRAPRRRVAHPTTILPLCLREWPRARLDTGGRTVTSKRRRRSACARARVDRRTSAGREKGDASEFKTGRVRVVVSSRVGALIRSPLARRGEPRASLGFTAL